MDRIVIYFFFILIRVILENFYSLFHARFAMSEGEVDHFTYPHVLDYLGLVNNPIFPLETADKWRHEFCAVCDIDGTYFRVSLKKCLFPGRCFDCKLNNKGVCFCFFGQHTKDLEAHEDLTPAFVERMTAWKHYVVSVLGEDLSFRRSVFPDMDVMFPARSVNRVPGQHMMPPLAPMLLQNPFKEFIPPSIFKDFMRTRHSVILPALHISWRERPQQFEAQGMRTQTVLLLEQENDAITDMEKRNAVCEMLERIYESWKRALCEETCSVRRCKKCSCVRGKLKKLYKDSIRDKVTRHIRDLLLQREYPFKNVPPINSTLGLYEDEDCRITKVHVET